MNIRCIYRRNNQSGNVFFAIFGAVALVGILGASVMTFMKGPLATSVKLTKINTAENQMTIGAQVAVMATTSQPDSGDCDADNFVEPMEWRAAVAEPIPTNGGLIPLSLGISKKDPWGTEYGYCVWNHGATTAAGGCNANMLAGTNSTAYPVVALISAGPDKVFTTTCRTFATADANADGDLADVGDSPLVSKAAETDDDVIFSYTYGEATAASGGLWSLKNGDPDTAVIGKNIETTGTASLQGGLLLPDKSLVTCDATTAGVMAMNGNAIEICDGSGWTAITGGASGTGLVVNPNTSSGMDITAPCGNATCYSSNVTFTVSNNLAPPVASDVLAVTLSNTANFEIVSDNCDGNSIAAAGNCQIVVRAKATGDRSYTATLSIVGNNSPIVNLDGTSSGFGCTVGGDAPGGKYVACGIGGYNLITTPSGCTASTSNPTCAGGADTNTLQGSSAVSYNARPTGFSSSGLQNTVDEIAYTSGANAFPAATWCGALEYGGYDDWFLPSVTELVSYFCPNRVTLGYTNAAYVSSTGGGDSVTNYWTLGDSGGCSANSAYMGTNAAYVRCMRWDPVKTALVTADTTPVAVSFTPSSGTVVAETRTSNSVTVAGITAPVTLSISGGTGAKFSKNGGAYTAVSTTVTNDDTISLQATSPIAGQEDTVSLSVGSSSFSWKVRTVANNTIYAFVTSATTTGGVTIAGADAMCASAASAAGLGGSWIALLATGTGIDGGPASRLPWNWTTMKNMNNAVVATSFSDFTDGSWSAPINRTAANAAAGSTWVWTGASDTTGKDSYNAPSQFTCSNWTQGGNGCGYTCYGHIGAVNSTTNGFNSTYDGCASSNPIYCIQDPGSALVDTDPADVTIRPGIAYSPGATATSNTVTVTSILQPVTVSITPSAGTADIIVNGVAQGATSVPNVAPNSTVQFSLTVPVVLGTKNTATLTIGDDTYSWWAGYADSAKIARIFVTSSSATAPGGLGGLTGADTICNTAAAASPYGLSSSWKAFLSDSTTAAANRISWNWGTLKTVTGTTVVDGGYNDFLDGTLDAPISATETGGVPASYAVTGSLSSGLQNFYPISTSYTSNFCSNYTSGANTYEAYTGSGGTALTSSGWAGTASGNWGYCSSGMPIYCVEDVDTTSDTTPATINVRYPVQVATSSRQTSDAVLIAGMSSGATTTLSVTATGGDPKFKVNGGAETASATVQNGDSVVFLMDAPATGNSSNKMTIKANAGADTVGYWRVWTGDTTGLVEKRVFVSHYGYAVASVNQGGIAGLDALCQTAATGAALGGTWKAIASGQGTDETQWAVNRIGYDWSTLKRIDNTPVVLAGNIWSTSTSNLLAPISQTQTGVTSSVTYVKTGSDVYGKAAVMTSHGQCDSWTNAGAGTDPAYAGYQGSSGLTSSSWINNGTSYGTAGYGCHSYELGALYCIEQ